jgi:PIN domain nuclease of toxin-antitoxin system
LNLLLDTHVFLWWDKQDASLNANAFAVIADPRNEIFISAASIWEVAIKRKSGKLAFDGSPSAAIAANGFFGLPVLPIDAENAGALDWTHNDPFDRMLVAQARRSGLILVTADSLIRIHDGVALLWAAAK